MSDKLSSTFKDVGELDDHSGYLKWSRSVKNKLKQHALWGYVDKNNDLHKEPAAGSDSRDEWLRKNEAIIGCINECLSISLQNAYESITTASELWKKLETDLTPKGVGFIHDIFIKFKTLSLSQCSDLNDYCKQFMEVCDEIERFSPKLKPNDLQLIVYFHDGLGPTYDFYVTQFNELHQEALETDKSSKYKLSYAMLRLKNSKATLAHGSAMAFNAQPTMNHQSSIRPINPGAPRRVQAQYDCKSGHAIEVLKLMRYCNKPNCRQPVGHDHTNHVDNYEPRGNKRRGDDNGDSRPNKKSKSNKDKDKDKDNKPKDEVYTTGNSGSSGNANANIAVAQLDVTAHFANSLFHARPWILDTGASRHIVGDLSVFTSTQNLPAPISITGMTGNSGATAIGTIKLPCRTPSGSTNLIIDDVLYLPGASANLISSSKLQRAGCPLEFVSKGIAIGRNGVLAELQNTDLYHIDVSPEATALHAQATAAAATARNQEAVDYWHQLTGHLGKQNVLKLPQIVDGVDLNHPPSNEDCWCVVCAETRMKNLPHRGHIEPGRYENELIHADIFGPIEDAPPHARYLHLLTEDVTKACVGHLMPDKSAASVLASFDSYRRAIERPDRPIHRLHTDEDSDYKSNLHNDYRYKHGIVWVPSIPANPQMNGVAERQGQTVMTIAHSLLQESGLPRKLIPEMIATAIWLKNRTIEAKDGKTPHELSGRGRPNLGFLKRLGRYGMCQKRNPPGYNWPKFQPRSEKGRLVGFEGNHFYRMLMPMGSVLRFDHVEWLPEKPPKRPASPTPLPAKQSVPRTGGEVRFDTSKRARATEAPRSSVDVDRLLDSIPLPKTTKSADSNADDSSTEGGDTPETDTPGDSSDALENDQSDFQDVLYQHPYLREPTESPDPIALAVIEAIKNEDGGVGGLTQAITNLSMRNPTDYNEPRTYKEAMANQYHKMDWQLGMQDEIDSLLENNTWTLVTPPEKANILDGKWVYKCKRGANNTVVRYKARWVVRGFQQREGIDFYETFATVVKPMSYKALFAIAAAYDLEIEQMDVKTAFLYGDVDTNIYIYQPTGFDDGSGRVCKLNKALYGLKQSPRIWYRHLLNYLTALGYRALAEDHSVFLHPELNTIIAVYVDDLLIVGPNPHNIAQLKAQLSDKFQMSDLGPCQYYLGMVITRDRPNRTLHLSQEGYIRNILTDHGMLDHEVKDRGKNSSVCTPMESTHLQPPAEDFIAPKQARERYQSAVGSLMYAMMGTRPDIAYAVSVVSRYASNPDDNCWTAVKRIFRYLRGTLQLKLTYKGPLQPLTGYSDSDYAGDPATRRSTSGYVFNLGSAAISWSSKRQPTVALSTCEAEYMGQVNATKEAIWLERLLEKLTQITPNPTVAPHVDPEEVSENHALMAAQTIGINATHAVALATVVFCDNQGAIALAKDPTNHSKTKHMHTKYMFLRECVGNQQVELRYCPTGDMVADGLTKPLPRDAFERFRQHLGLE